MKIYLTGLGHGLSLDVGHLLFHIALSALVITVSVGKEPTTPCNKLMQRYFRFSSSVLSCSLLPCLSFSAFVTVHTLS